MKTVPPTRLRRSLLAWYDAHRRVMPWRAGPGQRAEPYHVWLSEIMLQQTTVVTVGPYFLDFLERWPTVEDLAAASLDDVLHGWQGLGYYARARNLHRCAILVAGDHDGIFPAEEAALLALPGIGVYTAAAIMAIAFDRPASVMDGNVERVMARLFAVEDPLPAVKPVLRKHADALAPTTRRGRPGDYAQALMDLGATVCTPRKPACGRCPWATACRARVRGGAESLPRKLPKPVKPVRQGVVFWVIRPDGAVLIRRRPEKGLLGGMMEFPSTDWREEGWGDRAAQTHAPLEAGWTPLPGIVRHTFTHFHLELSVHAAKADEVAAAKAVGVWCAPHRLGDYALPTVMKKLVTHVMRTS